MPRPKKYNVTKDKTGYIQINAPKHKINETLNTLKLLQRHFIEERIQKWRILASVFNTTTDKQFMFRTVQMQGVNRVYVRRIK